MILVGAIMGIRQEFISAVNANQAAFGLDLSAETIESLADYFELVRENNPLLHLVAPCSPEEFAIRHILESLTLLEYLPKGARFADVGTGAGLPSIPCLIARDDLQAILIESKEKKANFLRVVKEDCDLEQRVEIIDRQFSETTPSDARYIICRALDKFVEKLPQLLKWSGKSCLLLFGGPGLEEALGKANRKYMRHLVPLSERRYLFRVSS